MSHPLKGEYIVYNYGEQDYDNEAWAEYKSLDNDDDGHRFLQSAGIEVLFWNENKQRYY